LNLTELVAELSERGIRLRVDGDRLAVDAPAGMMTAELRQSLLRCKPELITWLGEMREKRRQVSIAAPLRPLPSPGPYALSFAQQRLWVIDQLEGRHATYNLPATLELRGHLDIDALAGGLAEIVRRHEILRTIFPTIDGLPVQSIQPPAPVPLPIVDLRRLLPADRADTVLQLTTQEARLPFNLAQGPLMRTALLHLADRDEDGAGAWILMVTMHHIVSDGWSRGILIRELSELYCAAIADQRPALVELPVQYGDYAQWQRDWFQGVASTRELGFWQRYFAGAPPLLGLPSDRPRPPVQSFQGKTHRFVVDADLTLQLKSFARQHDATFFMVLLAAFAVLLSRYSGSEDITIGSPVANRTRPELEAMIGFFANTLAFRIPLQGNPSFVELLARVKTLALEVYAHQETPFDKVVEVVHPQRSLSGNPLFQVMFVLQTTAMMVRPTLSDLSVRVIEVDRGTAMFDLTFAVEEGEAGLNCAMEYSTDLFDCATIERLAANYQTLLASILRDSAQAVGTLGIMAPAERERTLLTWNRTARRFPLDRCFHQLFADQVLLSPDAIALAADDSTFSYRELDARANAAARVLLAAGLGREEVVAVISGRNAELVIALLAILKAGCVYLPIDPAWPADRTAQILQQAAVRLIVAAKETRPVLAQAIAGSWGIKVLSFDDLTDPETLPWNAAEPQVTPADLAYVIFTSGSTGTPKGAMIEQRGMLNHLCAKVADLELGPADVVAATAPPSFDISIWQFLGALIVGGCVRVFDEDTCRDPRRLLQEVERQHVSVLELVPTFLQIVLDELRSGGTPSPNLSRLRWLLVTGEALPPAICRKWLLRFPGIPLLNAYGPTECSDDVTHYVVRRPPPETAARVPIGRPIANTELYVLDANREPVPIGVAGELYVGGAGVGRGYLNDPERTREAFVRSPFASASRLYRTGDKVRYLEDGNLEFLGRIDSQVKIRGFRIEPGEIEVVLARHPAVAEAAVIAHGTDPEPSRLYAYVVASGMQPLDNSELRRFVKAMLPEYMVPVAFIKIAKLPYTEHGKIDRPALIAAGEALPLAATEYVEPRTPVEALLAEVWQETLGLEHIGIYDNFFDLGGDSILSIQSIAKARQRGLQLTARLMFQHQTIAELAQAAQHSVVVQAEQGILTGPVELVPVARAFLAGDHDDPDLFSQALMLEVEPSLRQDCLDQALQELVEHHDALRLQCIGRQGPVLLPPRPGLAVSRVTLAGMSEAEEEAVIERISQQLLREVSLEDGVMIRAAYFDGGDRARLLLIVHHLVIDGVSWRILAEDLATLYRRATGERVAPLAAKTTSIRQWAARLCEVTQTEAIRELDHWLAVGESEGSVLPLDRTAPGGRNIVATERVINAPLTAEETRILLFDVPQQLNAQMNAVLLTAIARSLGVAAPLHIMLEGHGRAPPFDDIDLSRTVGWFTTEFPVRLDGIATDDPVAALAAVEQQLRAVPNGGLGYGMLRYLHPEAAVRARVEALPMPDISLNYLGQLDREKLPPPLLRFDEGRSRLLQNPADRRNFLLEIEAVVDDELLKLKWKYSAHFHDATTIDIWADRCLQELRRISMACRRGAVAPAPVNREHWTPLVASQPGGNRPPFFCVHPIGGEVLCYAQLVRCFGADQPFYGLQAYGLAAGQKPLTRVDAMAVRYLEAIREVQPHGPYRLGGWSFGGLVAFAIANALRATGQEVSLLALIDTDPPAAVDTAAAAVTVGELYSAFAAELGTSFGKPVLIAPARIAAISPLHRPDFVLDEIRRSGAIPPEIEVGQIERLVRVFQANLDAALQYEPEKFNGRLALFAASETAPERPKLLARAWARYVDGDVAIYDIPATHFTIIRNPHVGRVANELRSMLG
jgi:amino acid adenylation domain-containing protein/non-ribosomal peptide synthase protein (TIGR01720 family)